MIAALAITLWWIAGIASFACLNWRGLMAITWGDLLLDVILGLLIGPAVWLLIGALLLIGAGFWARPIFRKRTALSSQEQ